MRADQMILLYFGRGGLLLISAKISFDLANHGVISAARKPHNTRDGAQTRNIFSNKARFRRNAVIALALSFDSVVNNAIRRDGTLYSYQVVM